MASIASGLSGVGVAVGVAVGNGVGDGTGVAVAGSVAVGNGVGEGAGVEAGPAVAGARVLTVVIAATTAGVWVLTAGAGAGAPGEQAARTNDAKIRSTSDRRVLGRLCSVQCFIDLMMTQCCYRF